MKGLLFILMTTYSSLSTPAHDVPIAFFHITKSEATIQLNVSFDAEDFSTALKVKTSEITVAKMQAYLDKHTAFQFNSKAAKLHISEVDIINHHIKIKGSFGKIAQKINALKIKNTCLNNVSKHSNVIMVDLNNQSKDYRMHTGRTNIELVY